ncbi:MAG: GntR family transcriptional regulator [Bacillota bacterium]
MSKLALQIEEIKKNKKNLGQEAYKEIKEAIIMGKLKPGEVLSENMLAKALGMSRTPIRDALKELLNEDLVEAIPGKGAFVKNIEVVDLLEIYEIREVLECMAAKTAVFKITAEEIQELENTWNGFLEKINNGGTVELEAVALADNKLHNLFIEKCSNKRLKDIIGILYQQVLRYQLISAQLLGSTKTTIKEHLEIIETMKEKDVEKIVSLLIKHIQWSRSIVERDLTGKQA